MFSNVDDAGGNKLSLKGDFESNDGPSAKQISPSCSRIHLPPLVKKDSLDFHPPKQEIKILCMKCEEEVSVRQLQSHRELHQALSLFRFTMDTKPTSVKQLLKRRRALIKRMNEAASSNDPVCIKKLHKLNLAYELLKSHVEGTTKTHEVQRDNQPRVEGHGTRLSCALAFGVCQEKNERWRPAMEDRYSYKDYFCNDPQSGFFGLFDGYSGPIAAEKCARYFHEILSDKIDTLYKSDMSHKEVESQVISAFKNAYEEMDKHLLWGVDENSRNRWSGCSALTCLLRGSDLYVANSGNIKAFLCKGDGSIITLSHDHSPWNKKERNRVKRATDISRTERTVLVNGLITSTRGLGNHGDPVLKSAVISTPDVTCISLDDSDQFLVLASRGIWEVFNESEVLLLLDDIMPEFDVKGVVRRISSKEVNQKTDHETRENDRPNGLQLDLKQSDRSNSEGVLSKSLSSKTMLSISKEDKAVELARTLSERLVESAILAGSKENVTASVILLKGCPLQMFLLPSIHGLIQS